MSLSDWLKDKNTKIHKYRVPKQQNIDFKAFILLGGNRNAAGFALEFNRTYVAFVSCHYAVCFDLLHPAGFAWSRARGNLF